ncbi:MAG TPA: hypothetical protein VN824_03230 [Puia sp.]|nr:hypothetical protein [Puia sp.]
MRLTLPIFIITALAPFFCGGQSLVITPGTQWVMKGQPQLLLSDLSFTNNGSFVADSSTVVFTGGNQTMATIGGSGGSPGGGTSFWRLTVNKTWGMVQVQRDIAALDLVKIVKGNLQLFATKLDLGTTGYLDGEQDNAAVVGIDQGLVRASAYVDTFTYVNPGKLGLMIRTPVNMGLTTIERTNTSTNVSGTVTSIDRMYTVTAENNNGLNATVVFEYLPSELGNPIDASSLTMYSADQFSGPWTNIGRDTSDTMGRLVIKSGLDHLHMLTLGDMLDNATRSSNAIAKVFPDPTTGVFTLAIKSQVTKVYTIVILSQFGTTVSTQTALVKGGTTRNLTININNQPAGYYYCLPDGPGSPAILFQKL